MSADVITGPRSTTPGSLELECRTDGTYSRDSPRTDGVRQNRGRTLLSGGFGPRREPVALGRSPENGVSGTWKGALRACGPLSRTFNPVRDINPTRPTPVVNYALIVANVAAFIWMQVAAALVRARLRTRIADAHRCSIPLGEAVHHFHEHVHACEPRAPGRAIIWFLWIFGDNVEDALGHSRYLAFYLGGGIAAAIVQILTNLTNPLPMIGASGAIAAVTGAYMVLYPRAPILVVNPILFTWLWLLGASRGSSLRGSWPAEFFRLEHLLTGVESLHVQASGDHSRPQGGVAVFAHLGGFIAGLIAITPLTRGRDRSPAGTWNGWQPPARSGRGYNGRP